MLIEIIIFLLLGTAAGTFTGLVPGIHINLVGVSLVSLSTSLFASLNPIYIVAFISSMAITHTFLDFIPSVFLGCPDTDTELALLPGHELLKAGKGYEAILLTAYGSLAAVFILVLIAFPSILALSHFYSALEKIIPYILIAVVFFLVLLEKSRSRALLVMALSGLLGLAVLNLNANLIQEPLLPLLTGLFGGSMLMISVKNKTQNPKQEFTKPSINKKYFSPLLGATLAAPFSALLPGLGSGQAAILGKVISKSDRRGFLFLLGATNTLVMGFSFIALYSISKTRTGAAVAIQQISGAISAHLLILILAIVTISGIISFFLTKYLAGFFSRKITSINYTKISIATLAILAVVVFIFSSGFFGVLVLIISTLTGIYCISTGARRINMMGCLLIPTILFYLAGI